MGILVPPQGRVALKTLETVLTDDSEDRCNIDLTHAGFVEPAGVVAIAAMVDRARRAGCEVVVTAPTNQEVRRYLARVQLGAHLDRLEIDHQLGTVTSHDVDGLCELRWFGSETELDEVAETIIEQYRHAGLDVVEPLYLALYELAVNAVNHSGQGGGYVALQAFPKTEDVAFAVADSGVGLRARIGGATDAQAIALAARKYQTSETGPGRGCGITGVIELTNKHRGSVTFYTGGAKGTFSDGQWTPRVSSLNAPFMGTLVNTRLKQRGD